jgi:hypothetical protein
MEIHISEVFFKINVAKPQYGPVAIQCPMWPTWSQLYKATRSQLSLVQLRELESLFRSDNQSRDFEVDGEILKIRSGQVATK